MTTRLSPALRFKLLCPASGLSPSKITPLVRCEDHMPGAIVPDCNAFLPSDIRTPQMSPHMVVDVPYRRDIGRVSSAHFHRIYVTYDGDAAYQKAV